MAWKQYVCNFFKELQLGRNVKFHDGFFETDDPIIQAKIESSDGFNVHIHFKDSLKEMERMSRDREEGVAADKARKRKEFLDEIAAEEKAENGKAAKATAEDKATAGKEKSRKELRAADRIL